MHFPLLTTSNFNLNVNFPLTIRSIIITLRSEKSFIEFSVVGGSHIDKKMKNVTIYGQIGEESFINLTSTDIKFFDQIEPTLNHLEIRNKTNLMDYEQLEMENLLYFLKIEYIIENCSKWEYFTNKIFENKDKQ